jgi:serine/threonine-protein kinase
MSPEQLKGKREDAKTDVWATGVLLFHLVTGTLPFGVDENFRPMNNTGMSY